MSRTKDEDYLGILTAFIRVCAKYRPKLGHGSKAGYGLVEFQRIYGADPFYSWLGLDHPLMYAAHKAAGGMTSIYRQIGIGCEFLFRQILRDYLGLSDDDVKWSYTLPRAGGRDRKLHLDARIPVASIADVSRRRLVRDWMRKAARGIDVDTEVAKTLQGIVFEIRQGYKSKDSKRQNADIANAATAYTKRLLPCAGILSLQIDEDIAQRYRSEKWVLLTGLTNSAPPYESFYGFCKEIVGYDLCGFSSAQQSRTQEGGRGRSHGSLETMTSKMEKLLSTRQNAELTFKLNRHFGRHGWLRLTPAYSVKLVTDVLARSDHGIRVLDPFSGTGTTPLCAAYANNDGTGVEINPFLTWLGNTKLATYEADVLRAAAEAFDQVVARAGRGDTRSAAAPPMHNLPRWWDPQRLEFLCRFKAALDDVAPDHGAVRDLLLVAFCRIVINLSNAAFNHQSMSFKDKVRASASRGRQGVLFDTEHDCAECARTEGQHVLETAADNPTGTGIVIAGDSRSVSLAVSKKYDLLITSPPYPNRMSYIRELRPYMYWLGYLNNGRDAGDMDWTAIGGTWGIATSRLAQWQRSADGFYPAYFDALLTRIRKVDNKSGVVLSNYIAKYFEDMWCHVRDVAKVIVTGGRVHYIVGNSRFYDTVIPVDRLFADMLTEAGFKDARIARLRKRNSKKELYEFDVSATK